MGTYVLHVGGLPGNALSGHWANRTASSTWDTDFNSALNNTAAANPLLHSNTDTVGTTYSGQTGICTFSIDTSNIVLDGGPPVSLSGLPAGFTILGGEVRVKETFTSGNVHLRFDSSHESGVLSPIASTFNYTYPVAITNTLSFIFNGFGIKQDTGTSNLYNGRIEGTYGISSFTWYYNSSTNQYEYLDADPGPPWTPQDPTLLVTVVDPAAGCPSTDVTVTGEGFGDGAVVLFDDVPATNVVVVDQTTITCTTPSHADGAVDVTVINADFQQATLASGYTYGEPYWLQNNYVTLSITTVNLPILTTLGTSVIDVLPTAGPFAANTQLTIVGTGFQSGAVVMFKSGGTTRLGTSVAVASSTVITCLAPNVPLQGQVMLIVVNPDGTSGGISVGQEVDVFNLQTIVQSCTQPDDSYVNIGLTNLTSGWWQLPPFNMFRYQPEAPSKHWVTSSAPGINGWYFSTNEFDGNVFTVTET